MLQGNGQLKDPVESWSLKHVVAALHSLPQSETPDFHLGDAMQSLVLVDEDNDELQVISSITSSTKKPNIEATQLAKNWGISLDTARHTIEATTQRGLRTILHNTLSQRFQTND